MERGLDPHMQRILDDAGRYILQSDQIRPFEHQAGNADRQAREWSFVPAARTMAQEPVSFSPFKRIPCLPPNQQQSQPYQQPAQQFPQLYQHAHPQLQRPTVGSSRLSLPNKSVHLESEKEIRVFSNADNHFRFGQNLRQGVSLGQPPPIQRQETMPERDPIGQLANAMLIQNPPYLPRPTQPLPPARLLAPEMASLLGSHANTRLSQLQPRIQQNTPPFNLSSFARSPETRPSLPSSSPLAGQASSPTTRVSLRRNAAQASSAELVRHQPVQQQYDVFMDGDAMPRTPVHQAPRLTERNYRHQSPVVMSQSSQYEVGNQACHAQRLALSHAPPMAQGIQLISPHVLPDRFRHVFPYELFNAAQSKCFVSVYKGDENVVVSAPTGSGKTAMLELAICKIVESYQTGTFKIVYLAPIKSLCSERLRDWTKKFSHLNLPCAELTGDTAAAEMKKVRDATIIVSTPEKWDSITRKWTDHSKLVQMVKLFLIDEVHILKDPRGATLEAIVSRMKKMSANVRFVALSATIPNSQDVATWLGKDHTNQHLPAHRETFGEDFRPVKLQRHVHGFDGMMNDFAFEKVLNSKLAGLIQKYTHKKPIIVFCYTRKSCEGTAVLLAEWWSRQRTPDRAWPAPLKRVNVGSKDLSDLLDCGIAFHHAGLDVNDRNAVETGFLSGTISVICCTSTLAVGVNLPCHLVVLKGTVGYQDGKIGEYSDLEVMQMLGRAGRPQFDDSAIAIIMTRSDKVDRYKKMISGQDTLESTLHLNFIELLNSEISLGTVKNVYEAKVWLNGTFLSVRMRQNPKYYSIDGVDASGDTDQRLEQACERDIKLLQENNLVTCKDQFACSEYGEAMSRYMVKFETMKLILSIPPKAKTGEILDIICQATEFKDLKMKPNERPVLREFNKSQFIKFPVKETVTTTAHKVSLMIQVQLGGVENPSSKEYNGIKRQFTMDTSIILERVRRLMRCVIGCKSIDEDAVATRHALDLSRSLAAGSWEYSNLQLRQIPGLGIAAVRKMVGSNISSIERLDMKEDTDIERIMSRNPPFGRKIKDHLAAFPCLELRSEIISRAPFKKGIKPKVNVKTILGYRGTKTPVWDGKKPSLTFMAETSSGRLVHFWRGNIMKLDKGFELRFAVELSSVEEQIKCWLSCDELVGTVKTSLLKHDIPASQFSPPGAAPLKSASRKSLDATDRIKLVTADEFGDDDFSDNDLVAAVQSVENNGTEYGSDEFADIDDLEALRQVELPKKSRKLSKEKDNASRMSNGKFACLHTCREGQLLKTGKLCKHKCCSEGLDKPPCKKKKRTMSDIGFDEGKHEPDKTESSQRRWTAINSHGAKKQKVVNRDPPTKFKSDAQSNMELENVEFIDVPEELPPVPYASLAPQDYHKLLYSSVQKDKDRSIRMPKQKLQFVYDSNTRSELPFFQRKLMNNEDFDCGSLSDDDFPTTTQLAGMAGSVRSSSSYDKSASSRQSKSIDSILDDNSLEKIEILVAELDEGDISHAGTPAPRDSLIEGAFDFIAFGDDVDETGGGIVPTSSSRVIAMEIEGLGADGEESVRETTLEHDIEEVKHRRTSQAEQNQESDTSVAFPSWVNDFDTDLIDQFKDYVDFID